MGHRREIAREIVEEKLGAGLVREMQRRAVEPVGKPGVKKDLGPGVRACELEWRKGEREREDARERRRERTGADMKVFYLRSGLRLTRLNWLLGCLCDYYWHVRDPKKRLPRKVEARLRVLERHPEMWRPYARKRGWWRRMYREVECERPGVNEWGYLARLREALERYNREMGEK